MADEFASSGAPTSSADAPAASFSLSGWGPAAGGAVWDQSALEFSQLAYVANITDSPAANRFIITAPTVITSFTAWLTDGRANNDGIFTTFSGTLGWAITLDGPARPGAVLYAGEDTSPTVTDMPMQAYGGDDLFRVEATLDTPIVLQPGAYWFALQEGPWGSDSNGTVVGWQTTSTPTGAGSYNYAFGIYTTENAYVLNGSTVVSFTEAAVNAAPQSLDAEVSFSGEGGDFAGGALVVSGLLAEDRVGVGSQGAITVVDGEVRFGELLIGMASGGVGGTLTVAFTADVTAEAIEALIEALTYANVSDTPTAARTLHLDVIDVAGNGLASPGEMVVAVTQSGDAPRISGFAASVSFAENSANAAPQRLDTNVSFVGQEGGGTLTVSGLLAEDRIGVHDEGTGAGEIGVSGSNITYQGGVIGSFAGGSGSDFTVTFNANASSVAIERLIESLTYANASDAPTADRTLQLDVVDANGTGFATPAQIALHVTPENDQPTLSGWGPAQSPLAWNQSNYHLMNTYDLSSELAANNFILTGTTTLSSLSAWLADGTGVDDGEFTNFSGTLGWAIYADAGGVPGAVIAQGADLTALATYTGDSSFFSEDIFRVDAEFETALTLAAGSYWLALREGEWGAPSDGSSVWWQTTLVPVNPRGVSFWNGSWDAGAADNAFSLTAANSVTFTETQLEGGAQLLDVDVTLSDAEGNFGGGAITVTGLLAEDTVGVRNQGNGAGEIGVSGSEIRYGGTLIGELDGGEGVGLTITLNGAATAAAVEALIENLTFANASQAPTFARTLSLNLTDGGGLSIGTPARLLVNVENVNDAPVLALGGGGTIAVNQGAVVAIAPGATVSDPDHDYTGGTLTASIAANAGVGDVLTVRSLGSGPGQIGLSGNSVTYGGVAIGSYATSATSLTITFNAAADDAAVQAVARALGYTNSGGTSGAVRTVELVLTDGDGGTSATGSVDIDLNVAPTGIATTGATWLWDETASADHFVAALTATDPDGSGGISYALTGDDDRFYIANGNELWERAGAVVDYETTPTVSVGVLAVDAGGASTAQDVTIAVRDFWDPIPTFDFIVKENSFENNLLIGTPAGGRWQVFGPLVEFYIADVPRGNLTVSINDIFTPERTTLYDVRFSPFHDEVYTNEFSYWVLDASNLVSGDEYHPEIMGSVRLIVTPVAYDANLNLAATSAIGNEDHAIALPATNPVRMQGSDQVTGLSISGLPVGAVLSDGTHSFTATAGATTADIFGWSLSSMTITPPADYHGTITLTYSATVTDSATLLDVFYSDTKVTSATITVTVNGVNDAPTAADKGITIPEDTPHSLTAGDFGAGDVDGNVVLVVIDAISGEGTLTYLPEGATDPVPFAVGGSISLADLDAGRLTFVPAPDASGTVTLNFHTVDDGGTANGGSNSSGTHQIIFTIVAMDDPATPADDSAATTEASAIIIDVRGNDSDPDGAVAGVTKVEGVAIAPNGLVGLTSGAVVWLQPDGTLRYDPNGAFGTLISAATAAATGAINTQATDSFSYTLADGSTATVTVTITGLDSAGDALFGSAGADVIRGTAGPDWINGLGGADQLFGGMGDDIYEIDHAGDRAFELAGQGDDLVRSSVSYSLAGQYIERLLLLGSAADGTGNGLANQITGNAAANRLRGEGGDDLLDGGAGADLMLGGKGDDSFFIDDLGDRVIELAGEGHDTAYSSVGFSLAGQYVEDLVLTGFAAIAGRGNGLANRLTGNDAANQLRGEAGDDRLDGAGGADLMIGGTGDDTYVIDDAADRLIELVGEGHDTAFSSVTVSLGGQYVEDLTLTGIGAIGGRGNGLANTITGNGADNLLRGDGGNDTLNGGAGADRLDGGDGLDTLTGGAGADSFVFNSGLNAATNVDTITDFEAGTDTLVLDRSFFTKLSLGTLAAANFAIGEAHDANDRVIYDPATGRLFYDDDGSGAHAAVWFASVAAGTSLGAGDFVVVL